MGLSMKTIIFCFMQEVRLHGIMPMAYIIEYQTLILIILMHSLLLIKVKENVFNMIEAILPMLTLP